MDIPMSETIAWLVPSAGNRWATEATRMPENASRRIDFTPCFDSMPYVNGAGCNNDFNNLDFDMAGDDSAAEDKENENDTVLTKSTKPPRAGLSLSFTQSPKGARGFVIGTDPKTCDIVLPKIRGVSRRHCHITFDSEKRLVVRDTSKRGTAVWYDGRSRGDRRRESWVLSSGFVEYGFPSLVGRIIIDIQNVRFQVIVNTFLPQMDGYQDKVDRFLAAVAVPPPPPALVTEGRVDWELSADGHGVVRTSAIPAPLHVERPVYIKYTVPPTDGGDSSPQTYLWNASKPWEPMVKVDVQVDMED